jgi:hypothetical protein
MDLQGLSTFVKYGSDVIMGYPSRKLVEMAAKVETPLSEVPVFVLTTPKICKEIQSEISDAYTVLCSGLVKAHKDYSSRENRMEKDRVVHGSISEQKQQEYDNSKRLFERLFAVVTALAECTGDKVPALEVVVCIQSHIKFSLLFCVLALSVNGAHSNETRK